MRATGWVGLPAFGSGHYYSWAGGGATSVHHIIQLPGADPATNAEYLNEQSWLIVESAHAHLSYINGSFPYAFRTDARDALAVGFSFEGENFDPYIAGDVYVSPTIVGNRSISVIPYTYSDPWNTGPGQVGPGSAYSAWSMGWGPVIKYMDYYRYEATAVVHLPTKSDIATQLRYVVGDPPYGSDGIRYSYLNTDLTSVIPQYMEIYFTAARDANNAPILYQTATLTPYIQWVPINTTSTPRIFGSVPGSPWVQAGAAQSLSYDGTGVAGPLIVDTSVLGFPDLTGYQDYGPYVILVAFYYTPNPPSYTDPVPDMPPDDGNYHPPAYDDWFAWSSLGYVYHYDAGQIRYRWIGPEVPYGGDPINDRVSVGQWQINGTKKFSSVIATRPPNVPFSENLPTASIVGFTRPSGRSSGDINVLSRFGNESFYVTKLHVTRTGEVTASYVSIPSEGVRTAGGVYIPSINDGWERDTSDFIAGNETSKMLIGGYANGSTVFVANVVDTATGAHVHCTGLPNLLLDNGSAERIPVFTSGSTFLLPEHFISYGSPAYLRYQRWRISPSGTATRVGQLMTIACGASSIYHDGHGDVWDEDGIVGVLWGSYDSGYYLLHLSVFDGTSIDPLFTVLLHSSGTNHWGMSPSWRLHASFYRTSDGYGVTYRRSIVNMFTTKDNTEWSTWVRRSVDITTGALSDEILLADTSGLSGYGAVSPLHRQDSGIGLIEIGSKVNIHTPGQPYYYFSDVTEDRLRLVVHEGISEGTMSLGKQPPTSGYAAAYIPDMWAGLWGSGGVAIPGRLYFKYREP